MRRLPIYFLIDVSESMVGEPIKNVQLGMKEIIQELRTDPYALESAYISIIAFAGSAHQIQPLTELSQFYPPLEFPIGSGTALGDALDFLSSSIDREVTKNSTTQKGDFKPLVFLFTDGTPTDNYRKAFDRWNKKYRKGTNLVAVSIGDNVNTKILGQITENVLLLKNTKASDFRNFFKWVSQSIKASSMSVNDTGKDELNLDRVSDFNIEIVDVNKDVVIDENFVVLHAKCSSMLKDYLCKYAKRFSIVTDGREQVVNSQVFNAVGNYPIDAETYKKYSGSNSSNLNINASALRDIRCCPHCGNQGSAVCVNCGNVFCVSFLNPTVTCPWCEEELFLREDNSCDFSINRTQG